MIVYKEDKKTFVEQVITNSIEEKIYENFLRETGHHTSQSEIRSWKNSMQYMQNVVNDAEIPDECTVAIEYSLPKTNKRIDFILTGKDSHKRNSVIIIELKQWESAHKTKKDAVVETRLGRSSREVTHPCYQAWSYADYLANNSETVETKQIALQPCAYLHNYTDDGVLTDDFYQEYVEKAPIFFKQDVYKLKAFIKRYISYGDNEDLMYEIENGRIRPSKQLADSLASMIKGNREFLLLDHQKVVYETSLQLLNKAIHKGEKQVYIVKGGPGTGKSVVAINLLVEVTRRGLLTQYVTKNSAPREVYRAKLTNTMKKSRYDNLFKNSGSYINAERNELDMLIVDC